ncbi:MAG TPA: MAPEG family protein [Sulfuricaulis sp.]|nr:MAPEG family protein [Sulfuricaulis sp.]
MDRYLMLYPVFAMVALTAIVWVSMYVTRLCEIRNKRIPAQKLATRSGAGQILKNVAGPSDNLLNLFELPVLFYVLMVLLFITDHGDGIYLMLAWGYVLLRVAHSFIHCTYNCVLHRFSVYLASSLVLWAMWAGLAWQVLGGA